MTLPEHSPELVELYVDFAAHMLSIPDVVAVPGAAEWLAERILFGLPDPIAHRKRPHSFYMADEPVRRALREFTYPDTRWHNDYDFARFMGYANQHLVQSGAPPFRRIAELKQWNVTLPGS